MAVSGTQAPVVLPLASTDLRFPTGLWHARFSVSGDGSAGGATASITWTPTRPNLIFSWEQISASVSATAADQILVITGRSSMRSSEGNDLRFFSFLLLRGNATVNAVSGHLAIVFPPFIPESGTAWTLDVDTINPGLGNTLTFQAWGYIWDLEALKFPGGPIRPGTVVP